MADVWRSGDKSIELRLGRWQEVLADVAACDAVITDPPYSERTHAGMRSGSDANGDVHMRQSRIEYESIVVDDIASASHFFATRAAEWVAVFADHATWPKWESGLSTEGLYTFGPVGWVKPNTPRFGGDGPALTIEWLCIARPRHRVAVSASRPGHYLVDGNMAVDKRGSDIVGQKALGGMRALIRDYTRPGDLVVDPYSGGCTTGIACAIEGRRFIGAECDPETFRKAVKRLSAGWTKDLFSGG